MAFGSLAWGYAEGGYGQAARWLPLVGVIWLLARWRRWRWFPAAGLFLTLTVAATGLWLELTMGWMLAGALGGLLAWDLSDFARRLGEGVPEDASALTRRHLARLTMLTVLALGCATMLMLAQARFTLAWGLLLGAVAVAAVVLAVGAGQAA